MGGGSALSDISPDLAARKLLVAAFLYYGLDQSIMSDGEYDKLSVYVSENWDKLDDARKFMLGTAADTQAGGSHFKFSSLAIGCAGRKYEEMAGKKPRMTVRWTSDERVGSYTTLGSISFWFDDD